MTPTRLGRDRQLRAAQRLGRPQAVAQHVVVELLHELCRRAVGDRPQARHDAFGACVEKTLGQTEQAFAADVAAERGFAGAQDDEVGVQIECIDVGKAQKSVRRRAGGIEEFWGRRRVLSGAECSPPEAVLAGVLHIGAAAAMTGGCARRA